MYRVESKLFYFNPDTELGASTFLGITEILENMELGETEMVYLKYNGVKPGVDTCQYGILSEKPLTSCIRFSKAVRKRKYIHFSDRNIDLCRPKIIYPDYTIYETPYHHKPGTEKVLGLILYESEKRISIISNKGYELRKCI